MKAETRIAWLIAAAIIAVLLYLLAPVLTPFVAAALLAYIGDPLADRLQALGLPRTLAVVAVFLITFLLLGALVLLVGPLVRQQVSALFDALPAIASRAEEVWLPGIAEYLDMEESSGEFGLSAFLARYGDMAG
ncbi:MAG TPA: AI-2E family transporter, partial [Woeseiaceae bacterium]|nr:AI-2E family transporter [Woeseiaceae bacterium]